LAQSFSLTTCKAWAWPDDVIRPMPLVLGRQAELTVTDLPNAHAHNQPQVFKKNLTRLVVY